MGYEKTENLFFDFCFFFFFFCFFEKTEEDTYLLDATGSELHAKEDIIVESTGSRGVARKSYSGWPNCNIDRKIIIHKFINKK